MAASDSRLPVSLLKMIVCLARRRFDDKHEQCLSFLEGGMHFPNTPLTLFDGLIVAQSDVYPLIHAVEIS